MPKIAPSATVHPNARLADDVEVGPGCHIGAEVCIGPGCRLLPNVTILGNTQIGGGNLFFPSAVIGAAPQDLKYQGSPTRLVIGDDNIFREGVTAHTGTEIAGGLTEIGCHNQFQVGTHIAHDVQIGSHCIMSNQVQLAGHVHVEDHVVISGLVGIQQFVTIGRFGFIAGAARCTMDVPPYMIFGYDGEIQGVNVKGLARWGFAEEEIQQLRDLSKRLFPRRHASSGYYRLRNLYTWLPWRREEGNGVATLAKRLRDAESNGPLHDHCRYLIDFLKRSIQEGVHGRYLEALRRDGSAARPKFYNGGTDR